MAERLRKQNPEAFRNILKVENVLIVLKKITRLLVINDNTPYRCILSIWPSLY